MSDTKPDGAFPRLKRQKLDVPLFESLLDIIPKEDSVIDIGAGGGVLTKAFLDQGYYILGIDGIPNVSKATDGLVEWVDLIGDCSKYYKIAKWGLFIEVGEHIPEDCESQLFDNVSRIPSDYLVVSWAAIGQRGFRHINCRTDVYVASQFARRGWFVLEEPTARIRTRRERRSSVQRTMILKKEN